MEGHKEHVMGINIREVTSDLAQKEKLDNVSGVYVASVAPGGAAEEAGLKAKDVIVKINDKNIASPAAASGNCSRTSSR